MAVTREQFVMQSTEDYLREQLFVKRGYSEDKVSVKDSFSGDPVETPLTKNWIAAGYNFDDGGKQAEMGSTLVVRVYTIEFFVFGLDSTWGQNLANAVKFSLENDLAIPIVDITVAERPETDEVLEVLSVSAERQVIQDPADWQRNCWTVHLRAQDFYNARVA